MDNAKNWTNLGGFVYRASPSSVVLVKQRQRNTNVILHVSGDGVELTELEAKALFVWLKENGYGAKIELTRRS